MRIRCYSDDVFNHAMNHTQAAIIWGKLGLNVFGIYYREFLEQISMNGIIVSDADGKPISLGDPRPTDQAWTVHHSKLLRLHPPLHQLKYLFFAHNPECHPYCSDQDLAEFLWSALDLLNEHQVSSASFNGVLATHYNVPNLPLVTSVEDNSKNHLSLESFSIDIRDISTTSLLHLQRVLLIANLIQKWASVTSKQNLNSVHLVCKDNTFVSCTSAISEINRLLRRD